MSEFFFFYSVFFSVLLDVSALGIPEKVNLGQSDISPFFLMGWLICLLLHIAG